MSLLTDLPLVGLTPSVLWSRLAPEVRELAARSIYDHGLDAEVGCDEADAAIAETLRFREAMVRKMPREKRIDYVARVLHPDDGLASTLLLGLHLAQRRPILAAFLDHLGIPHRNGLIKDIDELAPPAADVLQAATERLLADFDAEQIELYLASLLAMDELTWGGLREVLSARSRQRA